MSEQKISYLLRVEYLGFRFSGWQRQPGALTVEGMLRKTLRFVLPDRRFKILGAGRTDSKVSALDAAFELFLYNEPLENTADFLKEFNANLPQDIRLTAIEEVRPGFNVIHDVASKEYIYLFGYGNKAHPYSAPFMCNILEQMDLEQMRRAAQLFSGRHNFQAYTVKDSGGKSFERTILISEITENTYLQASFFPDKTYAFRVVGKGFLRYQVRLMMGALIELGKGHITLEDIRRSLEEGYTGRFKYVAPGSGLFLNRIEFG